MFSLILYFLLTVIPVLSSNSGLVYITHNAPQSDIVDFGIDQGWTTFNTHPRLVGDFDGDNQIDIIGFYDGEVKISYSDGTGFEAAVSVSTSFCRSSADFAYTTFELYPRWVGDVDGDGMDDIIGFQDDGVYVSFSQGKGNQFTAKQRLYTGFGQTDSNWASFDLQPRIVGFIDNDNMIDIVGINDTGVYIVFGNGRSNFQEKNGSTQKATNIFKSDQGYGTYWSQPYRIGDINGDGLGDIVGFSSDSTKMVEIAFQQSNYTFDLQTSQTITWGSAHGWNAMHPREVIDINNDGKADIIGVSSYNVMAQLSKGNQMDDSHYQTMYRQFCENIGWDSINKEPRFFGDINNDGIVDIIGFNNTGVEISFGQKDRCYNSGAHTTRDLNNSCQCKGPFYDNGNSLSCLDCQPPCTNCDSLTHCTSCNGANRNISDNSCSCVDGFYDNTVDVDCQQCTPIHKVAKCSSASTFIECKPGVQRTMNTSDCGCNHGYYDDNTNSDCLQCPTPHKVSKCTSSSSFTECKPGTQRTLSIVDCGCNIGYYDDNTNFDCQQCPTPHKIKKCTSSSNITECKPGAQRTLSTPNCGCNIGYYDDNTNSDCQQCPSPHKIKQCTSSSIITECKPGTQRTLVTPECGCHPGYFDDGINSNCQICDYPCQNCTSSSTCLSCQTPLNRIDNTSCICKDTFYDDDSDCLPCNIPCKNCSSSTICTSCLGLFRSDTSTCECIDGYYDNNSNDDCQQCPNSYKVKTCSSSSVITECKPGFQRSMNTSDCGCNNGYFDDGTNIDCQQCQYPCINCTSENKCVGTCQTPDNRDTVPTCSCQDGYFDNNSFCEQCNHNVCATCQNSVNDCLIPCQEGCSFCDPLGICQEPKDGYFLDPNQVPKKCSRKCQTCEYKEDHCLLECNLSCGICNREGSCDTCKIGYYKDSSSNCNICHPKCYSCNIFNTCTSCQNGGIGRSNDISQNCSCQTGFYEDPTNKLDCKQCPLGCKACGNQGICTICSNEDLLPPSCEQNKSGLIVVENDSSEQIVQICSQKCEKCNNSPYNCSQCTFNYHRKIENNCICDAGFHDNEGSLKNCEKCPKLCKKCLSNNLCVECENQNHVVLNAQKGKCECKKGFVFNQLKGSCQRCYSYLGKCYQICPSNTISDDQLLVCFEIQYSLQDNISLIWICVCVITLVIFLGSILNSTTFRKNQSEQDKLKREQVRKEG